MLKKGKITNRPKGVLSLLFVPHRGSLKTLRVRHYKALFLVLATIMVISGTVGVRFTLNTYKENILLKNQIDAKGREYAQNLSSFDTLVSDQIKLLEDTKASIAITDSTKTLSEKTLENYKAEYDDILVTYLDNNMSGISISRGEIPERNFKDDVSTLNSLLSTVEEAALQNDAETSKLAQKTANLENYLHHLPTLWPTETKFSISSDYGRRFHPVYHYYKIHEGVDIGDRKGAPVYASASGVVTKAEWHSGYGNLIEINHGNGFSTRYGHCSKLLVKVGQKVSQADEIALMGSTGTATGPHVHFEVRINGTPVNPENYISK